MMKKKKTNSKPILTTAKHISPILLPLQYTTTQPLTSTFTIYYSEEQNTESSCVTEYHYTCKEMIIIKY